MPKISSPTLYLLPLYIMMAVGTIYPIAYSVILSVSYYNLSNLKDAKFVGLENFLFAVGDKNFLESLGNTFVFTLGHLVFGILTGLLLALILNEEFRGKNFFKALCIFLPWSVSPIVNGFVWRYLLNPQYGAINRILLTLGVVKDPVPFLANSTLAMPSMIVAALWKDTPFIALLFWAALRSISPELYESAKIDGAGMFGRFRHISLPQTAVSLLIVAALEMMNGIGVFALVFTLTGGGPGRATSTIFLNAYQTAFYGLDLGYGAAISYIGTGLSLIFGLIYIFFLSPPGIKEA